MRTNKLSPSASPEKWSTPAWSKASSTFDLAIELIQAVRGIRGETGVKPSKTIDEVFLLAGTDSQQASIAATEAMVKKLAKIAKLTVLTNDAQAPQGAAATAVVGGVELRIPMAGLIDVAEETARITKELTRVDKDIAFVSKKLGNERFTAKAPPHIVNKEREKLAAYEQEKEALQNSLSAIQAIGN